MSTLKYSANYHTYINKRFNLELQQSSRHQNSRFYNSCKFTKKMLQLNKFQLRSRKNYLYSQKIYSRPPMMKKMKPQNSIIPFQTDSFPSQKFRDCLTYGGDIFIQVRIDFQPLIFSNITVLPFSGNNLIRKPNLVCISLGFPVIHIYRVLLLKYFILLYFYYLDNITLLNNNLTKFY